MNITRLNFKEAFPYLLNSISDANFVALDFEMSGILSNFTLDPSSTDTIQNRYFKTKCKAERFIPLQVGICPLKISAGKIIYSPFNIYLYPLAISEKYAEQFSFNSESMRFLAKNNFDFNQLFYEGIPFLSSNRMKRMKLNIQEIKEKQQQTKQYIFKSPGVMAFLNLKLTEVTNWISIQSNANQTQSSASQCNQKQIYVDIQFVRVKAYQSLIYLIKKKYPSLALQFDYLDINKNKLADNNFLARKYLKITKVPAEQLSQPSTDLKQAQKKGEVPIQSLQFNRIWQQIKVKKIPLIVHNGFLDLMHLYQRFIDDLPSQQTKYKECIRNQFPLIYDTKYLCNNSPVLFNKLNKDTSLGNCFKVLRQQQLEYLKKKEEAEQSATQQEFQSEVSQFCKEYKFDDQQSHHEAGYDALMTAYTFVNGMKNLHYSPNKMIQANFSSSVQYYLNKVPLGNIRIPYSFSQKSEQYQADSTKQFYFTCLTKSNKSQNSLPTSQTFMQKQIRLHNFFTKNYGPVRIVWQNRGKLNFTLTFLRPEDQSAFLKILDQFGYALYSIQQGDRYLVSIKLLPEKNVVENQSAKGQSG